jgi:hypothetical protein
MHNGDSRAELSYIDEKGNKVVFEKMNMKLFGSNGTDEAAHEN